MKSFYILTMGCQMNKNDSERISSLLLSLGYTEVKEATEASLLIINTCSVRQASEDKVGGIVRMWNFWRKNKPDLIIAVTGCMPGRDKLGKLKKKIPGADLWFGIHDLVHLPVWLNELSGVSDDDYLKISPARSSKKQAFISIQTGCNNHCTYCVVPAARGPERNRSAEDILNEVKDFAKAGGLEVTLLGQVVNHYIAPDPQNFSTTNPFFEDHFAALLWEINQIDSLKRIHFTAPDPQYFSDLQVKALALPKQMNFLHLPVQSGDNEILKKMNRKYTREKYLEIIKKIRATCPTIALGTDIIVGFCGETEEQFQNTYELFKECDFDIAYLAKYSERSDTPAARAFKDDVAKKDKKIRWEKLQALMLENVIRLNQVYLNRIVEVFVDKCEAGVCSGYSREMKLVQFLGQKEQIDTLVNIKIFEAKEWVLKGELVS
jgi:tRNA-2-methylthio-N6-dimethylallyladenosine synthase